MINIKDNFLEKILIKYLENIFIHKTPHYYGQVSNKGGKNHFYSSMLNINDTMINFLITKLKTEFKFNQILRSYLNVQYNGMNGDWHKDDGNNTILLMITKTLKKGSGQFQIKDKDNVIKKIDFIQNRVICFDATKLHR